MVYLGHNLILRLRPGQFNKTQKILERDDSLKIVSNLSVAQCLEEFDVMKDYFLPIDHTKCFNELVDRIFLVYFFKIGQNGLLLDT